MNTTISRRQLIRTLAVGTLASAAIASCGGRHDDEPLVLRDCPVTPDTNFGGIYICIEIDAFNELGFAYGDSVDVTFSNGYELRGIPYFNGYYVRVGEPLLVGYPGYPYIEATINYGDSLWETAGLAEGDTATTTLVEASAHRTVQESFDISYTANRDDYPNLDDAGFANFRMLSGGSLRDGAVYRSASPIANEYGRASYVEQLMADAGIAYVLDLSDNPDEVDAFMAESGAQGIDLSYFEGLLQEGCVGMLDLSASYLSSSYAEKLTAGLAEMAKHDGPYLVHCIEGKDRTGFVCALLEALAGASYDEILDDYMLTYANFYGIDREGDPERYATIASLNLDGMLSFLAGAPDDADLRAIGYAEHARAFLARGGMSQEDVDALLRRICG